MPFAALLPLAVPAIRLILRIQRGEAADPGDIVDDVRDFARGVSGLEKRRRLARTLEEMQDILVRDIDGRLTTEFPHADPGDVTAAVLCLSKFLDPMLPEDFSDLFVACKGNTTRLIHTLSQRAEVRHWAVDPGGESAELASFLLTEFVHRVVAVQKRAPELSISFLTQLLADVESLNTVYEAISTALDLLPVRVAVALSGDTDLRTRAQEALYTTEYLRGVADEYDNLQLYGLDLAYEVSHYSLTTAYVALRAERTSGGPEGLRSARVQRLHALIPESGAFAIIGGAGSGKSTLLQWFSVGIARRTLPRQMQPSFATAIPFVIKLRRFSEQPLPASADLASCTLLNPPLMKAPETWLQQVISEQKAVVMIDGVDEFPTSRKSDLLKWARSLASSLGPRTLFVLTGRQNSRSIIADVQSAIISGRAHSQEAIKPIVEIQPMDRDEIHRCAIHWHAAILRNSRQFTAQAIGPSLSPNRVADLLSREPSYRVIATTPLLCAAMCALFYVQRGAPPATHRAVYSTLIRMLILRERQRFILDARSGRASVLAPISALDDSQVEYVLQDLAVHLVMRGLSEDSVTEAREVVETSLTELRLDGVIQAGELLATLVSRSGIVREPIPGVVDFAHRSILEYLAAGAIVRNDDFTSLLNSVSDPNWAGTIVLTAAQANQPQLGRIVQKLLDIQGQRDGRTSTRSPTWLIALAGGVLSTGTLRRADHEKLSDFVRAALPPRTPEEVRAICSAGANIYPDVVASLERDEDSDPRLISAFIAQMAQYGTGDSLLAIAHLSSDRRLGAVEDLVRAWSSFDIPSFCSAVLEDLRPEAEVGLWILESSLAPYLGRLSPLFKWSLEVQVPDRNIAEDCAGSRVGTLLVSNAGLSGDERVRLGAFVFEMPELSTLSITGLAGFEHPGDEALHGLRELELGLHDGVVDLSKVQALNLRSLTISGACDVRLPDSIRISRLRVIDGPRLLTNTAKIECTTSSLSSVPGEWLRCVVSSALEELEVVGVEDLQDLELLSSGDNLREIVVEDCESLRDPSALAQLRSLESLKWSGMPNVLSAELLDELDHVEITIDEYDEEYREDYLDASHWKMYYRREDHDLEEEVHHYLHSVKEFLAGDASEPYGDFDLAADEPTDEELRRAEAGDF